jgi:hypothetical protein
MTKTSWAAKYKAALLGARTIATLVRIVLPVPTASAERSEQVEQKGRKETKKG